MPRLRRRSKDRRPSFAGTEEMHWLMAEPYQYDNWYAEHFGPLASLNEDMSPGVYRGFSGKSNERTPLTPEDVKYLPHWSDTLKALKRLRNVYDELDPEMQEHVPEDRKALLMAVDDNTGDPETWWDRKREEQAEIDKRTGRKDGELLDSRTGKPYNVKDSFRAGDLRGAARSRKADLRNLFDKIPEHIRIQVPEAWAVLDVWDDLLEHHDKIDLDKPFKLSYRSDAVEYTVKSFSALDLAERRAAVEREGKPNRIVEGVE